MHPDQKRIYQSMTPEKKLKCAMDLYYSARELKAAGLRLQHPEWIEEDIHEAVRKIFYRAGHFLRRSRQTRKTKQTKETIQIGLEKGWQKAKNYD